MPGISHRATAQEPSRTLMRADVEEVIAEILAPGHFFVSGPGSLNFERGVDDNIPWEVFRGRLLDPAQSRAKKSFTAWNVSLTVPTAGLPAAVLSIKYDASGAELFVMRAVPCFAWEGYDAGENVILSRESVKLVRELVGRINVARGLSRNDLREELGGLVLRAVVGTSRLPLTSVEAPLPDFALGQLGYFFKPGRHAGQGNAMKGWQELLKRGLYPEQSGFEKAKLLELVLRAAPSSALDDVAARFAARWQVIGHGADEIPYLLRTLFNDVSLSPYTGFVDNALAFVERLVDHDQLPVTQQIDFLGWLLRQLGHHLTAYDLVTFHHGGANYPDALLLDAVLKIYLRLVESAPELFSAREGIPGVEEDKKRLRRRALRQAWLLRRRYEGHAVPDAPTSPGENTRILPPPHVRVPEEQLTQPARRTRRLYADDPLTDYLGPQGRAILRQSVLDLHHPREMQELGMATFIERPLGAFKAVGEADQTLLFASEAFSPAVAARRLMLLERDALTGISPEEAANLRKGLKQLAVKGLPAEGIAEPRRPVVSLADARRVAPDFVFLRTLPRGVAEFAEQFDLTPLKAYDVDLLDPRQRWLFARVVSRSGDRTARLSVFDSACRERLELEVIADEGYDTWAGQEYPAAGLRVLRVWNTFGQEHDLTEAGIVLRPRSFNPEPAATAAAPSPLAPG